MDAEVRVRKATFQEAEDNLRISYDHIDAMQRRHRRELESAKQRLADARELYMNTPVTEDG